jgi:hypothetical protein
MRYVLAAAALLSLGACAEPIEEGERDEYIGQAPRTPAPADTISAEAALTPGIIDANLRRERNLVGDLGCLFRRENEVLLAAAANSVSIESVEGLIVLDGEPHELEMDGSGGYNSLKAGSSFTGQDGLKVEIAVSEAAEIVETPAPLTGPAPLEATMTITRGEQELSVEGRYECGPQPEA